MSEKEKEVYEHLLDKIKETSEPNDADTWASALERFCDAVRSSRWGEG